jgi:hypothetical protein
MPSAVMAAMRVLGRVVHVLDATMTTMRHVRRRAVLMVVGDRPVRMVDGVPAMGVVMDDPPIRVVLDLHNMMPVRVHVARVATMGVMLDRLPVVVVVRHVAVGMLDRVPTVVVVVLHRSVGHVLGVHDVMPMGVVHRVTAMGVVIAALARFGKALVLPVGRSVARVRHRGRMVHRAPCGHVGLGARHLRPLGRAMEAEVSIKVLGAEVPVDVSDRHGDYPFFCPMPGYLR